MKKKVNIVHVGVSGVPFGRSAAINRCMAIYSIFSTDLFNVLAINNKADNAIEGTNKINKKGIHLNISYQYTTPSPYKPNNFFKRRLYNFIGPINEFFLILKLGIEGKIDIMIFYPKGNFIELVYYRIMSKLFRFSLISHYVEYRSSFKNRKKKWQRFNDVLFDKYFMFFVDGIIPISNFLITHIKESKKNLPMIKIPPLVDFSLYDNFVKNAKTKKYFLYVGSAAYFNAIEKILEAYELINNRDYYLILILHGSGIDSVLNTISNHRKKDLIEIKSNLDYNDLVKCYKNAEALLIPISNSIQDKARFPQKISEYLASANPIITTNYGEVRHYFKDNINALVAKDDDPFYLSEKMKYVINNPEISKKIGLNGYHTGLEYFDNNSYKILLKDFLLEIIKI